MNRDDPNRVLQHAPVYAPANPAKQRKPKPGHPWAKFIPGLFSGKRKP